jgi:isochorismate synthase EntC
MELMVALRSAVIRANRARLFVGAGIVEGSTEAGEWEETEAKGLTIREALAGGGPDAFA